MQANVFVTFLNATSKWRAGVGPIGLIAGLYSGAGTACLPICMGMGLNISGCKEGRILTFCPASLPSALSITIILGTVSLGLASSSKKASYRASAYLVPPAVMPLFKISRSLSCPSGPVTCSLKSVISPNPAAYSNEKRYTPVLCMAGIVGARLM